MDQSFAWLNTPGMMSQGLTHDALGIATPPMSRWGSFSSQYASVTPALSMCDSVASVEDFSLSSVESTPQDRKAQWSYVGKDHDQSRSALERLGFKLQFGEKKTRDGQAPKRRGPKPDSKPALTRRQELNRQAQRTHRERKEMYIKALEQEVYRLKETQEQTIKERQSCNEQCRQLKDLLTAHGIPFDMTAMNTPSPSNQYTSTNSQFESSSNSSSMHRGSVSTGYTSPSAARVPALMKNTSFDLPMGQPIGQPVGPGYGQQQMHAPIDYEGVGVDFVLTLERSCKDHIALLMVRSQKGEEDVAGHALMASCPPIKYIEQHIANHPDDPHVHPHTLPTDLPGPLAKLLVSSHRVVQEHELQESEVTPIAAWQWIWQHPKFKELNAKDFEAIREDLSGKVRCYGFGAVIEGFEVRDALTNALVLKQEVFDHGDRAMQIDQAWSPEQAKPWSPPLPAMHDLQLDSKHGMSTIMA